MQTQSPDGDHEYSDMCLKAHHERARSRVIAHTSTHTQTHTHTHTSTYTHTYAHTHTHTHTHVHTCIVSLSPSTSLPFQHTHTHYVKNQRYAYESGGIPSRNPLTACRHSAVTTLTRTYKLQSYNTMPPGNHTSVPICVLYEKIESSCDSVALYVTVVSPPFICLRTYKIQGYRTTPAMSDLYRYIRSGKVLESHQATQFTLENYCRADF